MYPLIVCVIVFLTNLYNQIYQTMFTEWRVTTYTCYITIAYNGVNCNKVLLLVTICSHLFSFTPRTIYLRLVTRRILTPILCNHGDPSDKSQ